MFKSNAYAMCMLMCLCNYHMFVCNHHMCVYGVQDILIGLLRLRKVSGAEVDRQPELRGR